MALLLGKLAQDTSSCTVRHAHTFVVALTFAKWEKGKLSEHGKVSLASEQTLTFVSDNFGVIFQLVRRRVIIIRNFWGARLTLKDEWTTVGVFGCRVGRTRTGVASLRVRTNPAMKCTMSTVAHLPLSLYAPCNL